MKVVDRKDQRPWLLPPGGRIPGHWLFEQLTYGAERELFFELAATRFEYGQARLCCQVQGPAQKTGLADARRSFYRDHSGKSGPGCGNDLAERLELGFPLEECFSGHPFRCHRVRDGGFKPGSVTGLILFVSA